MTKEPHHSQLMRLPSLKHPTAPYFGSRKTIRAEIGDCGHPPDGRGGVEQIYRGKENRMPPAVPIQIIFAVLMFCIVLQGCLAGIAVIIFYRDACQQCLPLILV